MRERLRNTLGRAVARAGDAGRNDRLGALAALAALAVLVAADVILGQEVSLIGTFVIVLTAILSIATLIAIAWFGLRHQVRKLQREASATHTTITTGPPTRDLPARDDRY